jgi:hypothetical protein
METGNFILIFFFRVRSIENIKFLIPKPHAHKTIFASLKVGSKITITAIVGKLQKSAAIKFLGISGFINKFGVHVYGRTINEIFNVITMIAVQTVPYLPRRGYKIAIFPKGKILAILAIFASDPVVIHHRKLGDSAM